MTAYRPVQEAREILEIMAKPFNLALKQGRKPELEQTRALFEAIELVLRAYCRQENWDDPRPRKNPRDHLPVPLVEFLANQLQYIRKGNLPQPIQDLLKQGKVLGPLEDRDIGIAVAYIRAAKQKLIADDHPEKTVVNCYGVKDRTVRRWKKKHSETLPTDFFPGSTGLELGARIAERMFEAGKRYTSEGRGHEGRFRRQKSGHS